MYTVIIFGIVGGLVAIVTKIWSPRTVATRCGTAIFFALMFAALGSGFAHILGDRLPLKSVESSRQLAAMRSVDGVTGGFVWGSGTIGSEMVYRVYVRRDDGSMSPELVPANGSTRIVEDPSLHNEGVWRQTWKVISPVAGSKFDGWAFDDDRSIYDLENILTVPVGTVVHDFKAN